jgi:hypothetical protein
MNPECLYHQYINEQWFDNLAQARPVISTWRQDYDEADLTAA